MKTFRRIEVNAFHRRITVVSGEWPRDASVELPSSQDDGVALSDLDECQPVAPDSAEGQLILIEAVRTLTRRLTPEARAGVYSAEKSLAIAPRSPFHLDWQSLIQFIRPKVLRLARKEK